MKGMAFGLFFALVAFVFVFSDETDQFAFFCGKDIAFAAGIVAISMTVFSQNRLLVLALTAVVAPILYLTASPYLPDSWLATQNQMSFRFIELGWLVLAAIFVKLSQLPVKQLSPVLLSMLLAAASAEPWSEYYEYLVERDIVETGDPLVETKELQPGEVCDQTLIYQLALAVGYSTENPPQNDFIEGLIDSAAVRQWLVDKANYAQVMSEISVLNGTVTFKGYHRDLGERVDYTVWSDGHAVRIDVSDEFAAKEPISNLSWLLVFLSLFTLPWFFVRERVDI